MDVGIVCSYGVILDRRLQTYLGTLIRYVTTRQIHTLILSGGQTRTSIVKTEARVLYEALQPRLPYISCILEEHAITTFHNLRYSKAILEQRHIPVDTLYIFCDSARFFKVRCLARLLFAGTRVHVVKFPRKEPFLIYLLQVPFTLLQCLAVLFPSVEKVLLKSRQWWMRLRK